MRRHEPLAVVPDERQQVRALLARQVDFAHAEKEDRVEVVQVADVELFAGGDAGPFRKHDRVPGDQLRVGADERVVVARFTAQALDGRQGVRDRIVLIAVLDVGPCQQVFARPFDFAQGRRGWRWQHRGAGGERREDAEPESHLSAGRVNARIFVPGAAPRKLPPPAATTTYWRLSLPRKVIGVVCAHAGSSVSQSCLPLRDSNARKRQSMVAPMKISPLAVAMLPPMFSVPVLSKPFALSDSTNPSGTLHATSPRLTSRATSSPNGGAEHGIFVSGFQNRPTAPPHGLRRTHVVGPPPRAVPCTILATCPRFITLVNARPSVGS